MTVGCAAQPVQPLTEAELLQVERAEQALIQECMTRHGFRYWPPAQLSAEERKGSKFMLTDVNWARRNGYGGQLRNRVMAAKAGNQNHVYATGLPAGELARYNRALDGGDAASTMTVRLPAGGSVTSRTGGCTAEAYERLYGDRSTWLRVSTIATNLQPLYMPDLVDDRRFVAVLRNWSQCMAGRGHPYPNPVAIRSSLPRLTKGLDPAAAHAVEVELAVAEATCARSASYPEIARSLEDDYRERAARPYSRELDTYRRLGRAAFEQAKQINETRH
ncbi:hypothetical protein [Nonomuraea sp. 10N515B]|uniref:hypothetical protein n=1 Tax=Nonomuraea sp. 10N515B TaxID=3457422 RepID=UPI003FCC69D2